jgi:putative endonuclease
MRGGAVARQHNAGIYDGYAKKRPPVGLVFTETCDWIIDAVARDQQFKGWSRVKRGADLAEL